MSAPLSGPGLGLPLPQALYPTAVSGSVVDAGTNRIALAPGEVYPIPAGDFYISLGDYLVIQYNDPVTGVWVFANGGAFTRGLQFVKSDGFNYRIANLTGCLVGALVTAYGTGWVQASTSIVVTGSTATFKAIVGGQLTASVASAGAGYGLPPLVLIPAPPNANNNPNGVGGIPASAYAVITSGTVTTISFTNPGAGYPVAPGRGGGTTALGTVVLVPNPADPNINTGITNATITFSLTGSGSITGALATFNGAPLADGAMANVTLAVSGAGSSATVVPQVLQTVKTFSVSGAGDRAAVAVATVGGGASAGTIVNSPEYLGLGFIPRPASGTLATTSANFTGTPVDGGLFMATPTAYVVPAVAAAAYTLPTIAFVMGSRPDIAIVQPAP